MAVKLVKKAFGGELIFCVFINKGRMGNGIWKTVFFQQFAPRGVLSFAP